MIRKRQKIMAKFIVTTIYQKFDTFEYEADSWEEAKEKYDKDPDNIGDDIYMIENEDTGESIEF